MLWWIAAMGHDLRFALRTLARSPLFTAVAVLSLALGIGANTSIFSLLDQVLYRSLPVRDPKALTVFHVADHSSGSSSSDDNQSVFSYRSEERRVGKERRSRWSPY